MHIVAFLDLQKCNIIDSISRKEAGVNKVIFEQEITLNGNSNPQKEVKGMISCK